MKRSELLAMREDCFQTIITACQAAGPVPTWSADARMTLTMLHLVYQTVVTELAQVDGDMKVSKLVCLLDGAKGSLLDLMHEHGVTYEATHPIRLALVEALDLLET